MKVYLVYIKCLRQKTKHSKRPSLFFIIIGFSALRHFLFVLQFNHTPSSIIIILYFPSWVLRREAYCLLELITFRESIIYQKVSIGPHRLSYSENLRPLRSPATKSPSFTQQKSTVSNHIPLSAATAISS